MRENFRPSECSPKTRLSPQARDPVPVLRMREAVQVGTVSKKACTESWRRRVCMLLLWQGLHLLHRTQHTREETYWRKIWLQEVWGRIFNILFAQSSPAGIPCNWTGSLALFTNLIWSKFFKSEYYWITERQSQCFRVEKLGNFLEYLSLTKIASLLSVRTAKNPLNRARTESEGKSQPIFGVQSPKAQSSTPPFPALHPVPKWMLWNFWSSSWYPNLDLGLASITYPTAFSNTSRESVQQFLSYHTT